MKTPYSDNGGEFTSMEFKEYLKKAGKNMSSSFQSFLSKMELLKDRTGC